MMEDNRFRSIKFLITNGGSVNGIRRMAGRFICFIPGVYFLSIFGRCLWVTYITVLGQNLYQQCGVLYIMLNIRSIFTVPLILDT